MFGLFKPRCPLDDPRDKVWTELSMLLLAQQLGIERLKNAEVLTPTLEHFPEPFHGTVDEAHSLMSLLCRHMQINESMVRLRVRPEHEFADAAGTYSLGEDGIATIHLSETKLLNLEDLLATLAHELSHQILIGERRVSPEDADDELLTDLVPIFLGVGLFGANATIRESTKLLHDGEYAVIRRLGYLTSPLHGYALALFAWVRGETDPPWAASLRLDARHVFRKSLKYLIKTENSLFHPDTAGAAYEPRPVTELVEQLGDPSAELQIAALWALYEHGENARDAVAAVIDCTSERPRAVRVEALHILPHIGAEPSAVVSCLLAALTDDEVEIRFAAVEGLKEYPDMFAEIVGPLTDALIDPQRIVALEAANSLCAFGTKAQSAAEYLVQPLRRELIRCNNEAVEILLYALREVHPHPEAVLAERFADDDPEFLRRAREALTELNAIG